MSLPYPVRIAGVGRYLPRRVVDNATVERRVGLPLGTIDRTHAGVVTRRWAERDETNSFMAAEAAREALDDAGVEAADLDLIVNASGSQEQAVPDGGPLVQRQLGLGESGIPTFTLHSTCLSFLNALDVVGALVQAGRYRKVLVVTSEIPSSSLNPEDIESACLFGDAATAVVLTPTPAGEASAVVRARFETYGDGADYTRVLGGGTRRHPNDPDTRPEDNLFEMDGRRIMAFATRLIPGFLERLDPPLLVGEGVEWVVPHQPSQLALQVLGRYGFEDARIGVTIDHLGNCGAASAPATLYEMVRDGRIQRGDRLLLIATGAGLGLGGVVVVY